MKSILAAALAAATAVQMMPPGNGPEQGFAGVWRVIAAESAPWAGSRHAAKAPLLEYAVEFADGAVKGPPALACNDARYASGVTYDDGLFGGKLIGKDEEANARNMRFTPGGTTTYRVLCGAAMRDYYIDHDGDLITADGDVLYTLQRPTGMEPEEYRAGYSGPSFDCARARTAAAQMICGDASLSKSDRELSAAFARLRAQKTPRSFATVRNAQRGWLGYVLKACGANGAMPDDQGARNDIQQCLSDNYNDRAERFGRATVARSGALALEPRMRMFSKTRPATEDSDTYPWMTGGAQAAPFDAWIAKRLALDKRRMDDKDLFPFGGEVADMKLSARRTYTVTRFDARVASLLVSTFDYTGGAHEAIGKEALNWDMVRQRPFGPKDVFAKDWRRFATGYCLTDLAGQQSKPPDLAAVEEVGGGDNWLFAKGHATVHFTVYTITSFAGGEFDIDIPYTALKPYLRSDAPVP